MVCAVLSDADDASSNDSLHRGRCQLAHQPLPSVGFTMSATGVRRYMTAAEFLAHPAAATASELVRGALHVMTPASGAHGVVAGTLFAALNTFVEHRKLGMCFPDNTGFQLPGLGDTVRSPDVAFVRADRLPADGIGSGWMTVAPDLVVEILSPTETDAELEDELNDYRSAGTRLFWIVDPQKRSVSIRDAEVHERVVHEDGVIDGANVLPGFVMRVEQLFARLANTA